MSGQDPAQAPGAQRTTAERPRVCASLAVRTGEPRRFPEGAQTLGSPPGSETLPEASQRTARGGNLLPSRVPEPVRPRLRLRSSGSCFQAPLRPAEVRRGGPCQDVALHVVNSVAWRRDDTLSSAFQRPSVFLAEQEGSVPDCVGERRSTENFRHVANLRGCRDAPRRLQTCRHVLERVPT